MCDCYKIGGPWIAEDPDCPEHGILARREREEEQKQIESYLSIIHSLDDELTFYKKRLSQLESACKIYQKVIGEYEVLLEKRSDTNVSETSNG